MHQTKRRGKKPIHLVLNLKTRLFTPVDVIGHTTVKSVGGQKHGAHTVMREEELHSPACRESLTDSQQHPRPGQTSVPSSHAWISSGGLH